MYDQNEILQSIEQLYSEYSKMNNMAKLAYLRGRRNRLNQLASQFAIYLRGRVGITPTERQYAQNLLNMIHAVDEEGMKSQIELGNEWVKEFVKMVMGW